MNYFSELKLSDNFKEYKNIENNPLYSIALSKINIAVGSNNSGKSRFFRKILSEKKYIYKLNNSNLLGNMNSFLDKNKEVFETVKQRLGKARYSDGTVQEKFDNFKKIMNENKKYDFLNPEITFKDYQKMIDFGGFFTNMYKIKYDTVSYSRILEQMKNEYKETLGGITKTYIPTLRSLRNLDYICQSKNKIDECFTESKLNRNISFDKDFFKGRTLTDYWNNHNLTDQVKIVNLNESNKFTFTEYEKHIGINIFTGLNLYDEITDMLLGDPEARNTIVEWEKFLSLYFFENKKVSITPNRKEEIIKLKLDDDEKPIYDLGDGLQSIIIITFVLFKNRGMETVLVIEEPELFLHPTYQRQLIKIMMLPDFNKIQYFAVGNS